MKDIGSEIMLKKKQQQKITTQNKHTKQNETKEISHMEGGSQEHCQISSLTGALAMG